VANGGDFQRASDPWVTFSPNGNAYFISLSITFLGPTSATGSGVLVSKSTNGCDTWSDPVTLVRNTGDADVAPFFFNDKESITADPFNSNYVYAVWDRVRKPGEAESVNAEHSFAFRGDTLFSRTTDGGQTWEPPRAIFKRTNNAGTIGNQIAVLPGGTLVDIFDSLQARGRTSPDSTSRCSVRQTMGRAGRSRSKWRPSGRCGYSTRTRVRPSAPVAACRTSR
jgi:hypothetical protein